MDDDDLIELQRIQITVRPLYGDADRWRAKGHYQRVARQPSRSGPHRRRDRLQPRSRRRSRWSAINIDVLLNIGQQTASELLAVAIRRGIAPIVRVLRKRIARLITVVHKDEGKLVRYIVDPHVELKGPDAMPADYEMTVRTESRTRVWAGRALGALRVDNQRRAPKLDRSSRRIGFSHSATEHDNGDVW